MNALMATVLDEEISRQIREKSNEITNAII